MRKYVTLFSILILGPVSFGCKNEQENRNRIEFKDPITIVEDSLRVMEHLLRKLPDVPIKNYFITDKGYIFINSNKIGLYEDIRKYKGTYTLTQFENFDKRDVERFIKMISYLKTNFIESAYTEPTANGKYVFIYRQTGANEANDVRDIMLVKSSQDTLNEIFANHQRILDRKGGLVLLAPIDIMND